MKIKQVILITSDRILISKIVVPLSRCPTSFPSLLFVALCLSFCRCIFVCASFTDCASDRQPSVSLSCSFVPVLDVSLHLCRRVCPFVGRSGGPSHYGSKAFKSTHWGKRSLTHLPHSLRSAQFRSAVLRSTPLCSTARCSAQGLVCS